MTELTAMPPSGGFFIPVSQLLFFIPRGIFPKHQLS